MQRRHARVNPFRNRKADAEPDTETERYYIKLKHVRKDNKKASEYSDSESVRLSEREREESSE